MGEVAQLLDRLLHVDRELLEHLDRRSGSSATMSRARLEVHRQRHEVLLGAVVQVALDAAALGVGGGHDPRPRGLQLAGLAAHLVEALLQRGVEVHVVQGQADLAGQLGEGLVVGLGERLAEVGPVAATISPRARRSG